MRKYFIQKQWENGGLLASVQTHKNKYTWIDNYDDLNDCKKFLSRYDAETYLSTIDEYKAAKDKSIYSVISINVKYEVQVSKSKVYYFDDLEMAIAYARQNLRVIEDMCKAKNYKYKYDDLLSYGFMMTIFYKTSDDKYKHFAQRIFVVDYDRKRIQAKQKGKKEIEVSPTITTFIQEVKHDTSKDQSNQTHH